MNMSQLMDNIIQPTKQDNLTSLARSSSIPNSEVSHNSVYFSSNCNHLSDKYIWAINGSKLEVYSYNYKCNNRLISSFDFGQIFNDPSIAISCVTRLTDRFEVTSKFRHPHKLIVILSLANNKSYICIVDVRLNSVLNTIEFPFTITCAEVILSGVPNETDKWPLVRELLCMNGILAIGCDGGLVFFIDLILDSYSPVPLIPKQISIFTCNSAHIDLINKRRTAIFHNQVICIPLNTDAKNKGKFNYRTNDGAVLSTYQSSQIYVSALHFIPQLALVCVGYNFGGFHLYNLNLFKLECSCGLDNDLLPVVSFAFQPPENDPKNYSYLWVVRGICLKTPNVEWSHKSCSTAFLYLLCYENKEFVKDYGILYNTFKLCFCKFEFCLTANPYDKNSNLHSSSQLLDMFTIQQASSLKLTDDDVCPIDYNLFFIAWQAQSSNDKVNSYFLLFDLNQWYKTQMPKCFCVDDGGLCPFISIYSLNSPVKTMAPESLQAIYFHNNSISKFSSNLFYLDIHSYPASLSLNLTVASQGKICNVSYLGFQKKLLNKLIQNGASTLLDPEDTVTKCYQYGLIHPEYVKLVHDPLNEIGAKRELVLSIALENNLMPFLIGTIKEWSSGAMTNVGCDLKHILDWLWNKVHRIKESIDSLTTPLFDFSGYDLLPQDIAKLFTYEAMLSSMSLLLTQLRQHATALTQQGFDQLVARSEIVQLIRSYLKIILLFHEFNMLPQQDASSSANDSTTCYSYSRLADFYSKRRKEVSSINPSVLKDDDVLLIDTMVHHLGPHISGLWQHSESNSSRSAKCAYPPPNLHSLIRLFLRESIPLVYKESLLLYFLFDFCDHLADAQVFIAQKIMIFMSSLNMSQGIRNFIRGLWFLDHQQYSNALHFLTHPLVTSALTEFKENMPMFNAIIQRIVQLFLFGNEYKSALIFSQCCGHFLVDTEKNENLYIQMLLLNGDLTGAIDFQRQRRGDPNSYQIVQNLFFVCERTNNLTKLCRIPLDEFEEAALVNYLLESSHQNAKRILILYFILNNKLLEAIDIVKQFGHQLDFTQEENKRILELIDAYSSRLPLALSNLAEEISNILSKSCEFNLNDVASKSSFDETAIKIIDKQRNIHKIYSSSNSLEKVLEVNEVQVRRPNNGLQTPSRSRPIYLSPSVSRSQSRVAKAKHQCSTKDLFTVLRTPDVMRKAEMSNLVSSFTDSPRKPSILKHSTHDENESDLMSDKEKGLKVSFLDGRKKRRSRPKSSVIPFMATTLESTSEEQVTSTLNQMDDDESSVADHSEIDEAPFSNNDLLENPSDSPRRRPRLGRKTVDTPTHRMQLRSKKPGQN